MTVRFPPRWLVRSGVPLLAATALAQVPGTFTPFGTGCAGVNGIPQLTAPGQPPRLGDTFVIKLLDLPLDHYTTLWLGLSDTAWTHGPLPFDLGALGMPGCTLYVRNDYVTALLNYGGTAFWNLPIPNDPRLVGLPFWLQAGALDRVNALGMVTSNAAACVIGQG